MLLRMALKQGKSASITADSRYRHEKNKFSHCEPNHVKTEETLQATALIFKQGRAH